MNRENAFTLVELLVAIAVIAILASLLLPALGLAKARGQATACRNNLRQLQLAWFNYAMDNCDRLPLNHNSPGPYPGGAWWCEPGSWVVGNARCDSSTTNIERGTLFLYALTVNLFRCPSDRSNVPDNSQPRTRSYSLSGYFGERSGWPGTIDARQRHDYTRVVQPSRRWVLLDTSEKTINEGAFYVWPVDAQERDFWDHQPSDRHGRGANLTFTDGHVEHWSWKWPKQAPENTAVSNEFDQQDLRRLQELLPMP
jgi:prepilin-type N-terminal cleavage/methylation domain-containing protein/prepilin-type processing-associated H-X9-DG protein